VLRGTVAVVLESAESADCAESTSAMEPPSHPRGPPFLNTSPGAWFLGAGAGALWRGGHWARAATPGVDRLPLKRARASAMCDLDGGR
jgi:hypothetical protein